MRHTELLSKPIDVIEQEPLPFQRLLIEDMRQMEDVIDYSATETLQKSLRNHTLSFEIAHRRGMIVVLRIDAADLTLLVELDVLASKELRHVCTDLC
jgi:hypothetical protein